MFDSAKLPIMYIIVDFRMVQAIQSCNGSRPSMKWLGIIAIMAVAALILSVVTDVEVTKCQSGSAYAMMHFCKPDSHAATTSFECRFRGSCE
jgi:hypothetical protein